MAHAVARTRPNTVGRESRHGHRPGLRARPCGSDGYDVLDGIARGLREHASAPLGGSGIYGDLRDRREPLRLISLCDVASGAALVGRDGVWIDDAHRPRVCAGPRPARTERLQYLMEVLVGRATPVAPHVACGAERPLHRDGRGRPWIAAALCAGEPLLGREESPTRVAP